MNLIRPDDELYVGIANKSAVMFKEGLIFTARLLENTFVDVNLLMSKIERVYGATCDSKVLFASFDIINVFAKHTLDRYVHLVIEDKSIKLSITSESRGTSHSADAVDTIPTPSEGFYYIPGLIMDFLKFVKGEVNISIDAKGFLMLDTGEYQYAVTPRKKPVPKEEKKAKSKAEPKKAKKPKSTKKQAAKVA